MSNPLIPILATILILGSTFPQTYQSVKTRKTDDINLPFLAMCVSGQLMWVFYGIEQQLIVFIIGEGLDMVLWGIVLYIKVNNVLKNREVVVKK